MYLILYNVVCIPKIGNFARWWLVLVDGDSGWEKGLNDEGNIEIYEFES